MFELQTQLELACDLKLLKEEAVNKLMEDCEEVARLTNGLLKALENTSAHKR